MPDTTRTRVDRLDLLRGAAVLLVLGRHLPDIPGQGHFLLQAADIWKRVGWIGVDLFFVLSGFLVSGLLFTDWQRTGRVRLGRFLIRRGLKIYPAFYFFLLLSVTWIFHNVPLRTILTEALFVQNYLMGISNLWSHTWSLAIEEHFYLTLGALLFILFRIKPADPFRSIPLVFAVVAVFCLTARLSALLNGASPFTVHLQSHYRFDALFFGVFLSYWHHFHRERIREWARLNRNALILAAISFPLPCVFLRLENDFFIGTLGLTLAYLGFGALLLLNLYDDRTPSRKIPAALYRAVCFIGVYSYSIYLWHVPCRRITTAIFLKHLNWDIGFFALSAVYLVMALCQGVLMAKLVERPFLKWRDRWCP